MKPLGDEKKNLIRFLAIHPIWFMRIIITSPRLVFKHLLRKRAMDKRTGTAKNGLTKSEEKEHSLCLEVFPLAKIQPPANERRFNEIKLASLRVPVADELDWKHLFKDIEDTFSLNRFGWLFTAIHTQPSEDLSRHALDWILNWIETMGENIYHPAWESYSVSERLANWPFIVKVIEHHKTMSRDVEQKIAASIGKHLDHLVNNLELNGPFTNNHILNNARGLYIGGLFIDNRIMIEKAKALFYEWIPRLIDESGMSKEDSSHYQCLICQRLEQIYHLSLHTEDETFTMFMKKWVIAATNARESFIVSGSDNQFSIPLFGDISPDFNPEWFFPKPEHGWEAFKNKYNWVSPTLGNEVHLSGNMFRKISNQFLIFNDKDVSVFWHLPQVPVRAGSHGHFDVGSFVFFLKGKEIFADPGRYSYSPDGSGSIYARAHSSLIIDGLGPFCEDYRLNLLGAYPHQRAGISMSMLETDMPRLSIRIDGFRRLAKPVRWERSFSFKDGTIIIRDDIKTNSSHEIETRFVIADGLFTKGIESGLNITSESGSVMLKAVDQSDAMNRLFSVEDVEICKGYGHSKQGIAFVVKETISGSRVNTYAIEWNL